ncbi:MAG: TIGR03435 family protein [Terracidiphilus sp.]
MAAAFALAALGGLPPAAPAQLLHPSGPLPSFEVATIKPNHSAADSFNFSLTAGRFMAENAPLARLIRFAYDVKSDGQVQSMPGWAGSEKFDIDAKMADAEVEAVKNLPPDRRFEQYQLMLQSLLADRFKMKVSTRMKELPVYALAVAKGGEKLTPAVVLPDPRKQRFGRLGVASRGELEARSVSMARFSQWLSGTPEAGGRAVIDETGLTGRYNFTLKWTPLEMNARIASNSNSEQEMAGADTSASLGPSLFTALQSELGLKLEPRKAPVQVLVIDHVEQPSPN